MAVDLSKLMYANNTQPYMDAYERLKTNLQSQRNTDVSRINANRDADIQKSNAGYDNTARQNYINYMQAQKRLPSELNAMGIRGGASESSLLRLGTNYGTNVANNESARQNALAELRNSYAKQISDYDSNLNERLASAEATARQNQIDWEREQIEKDLQYFSGAIEGLYSSKDGYKKLISKLKASNDPNKAYKIMLATRAMNQIKEEKKSSGGGGGGRSYGGYSGGYSSSSSSSSSGGSDGLTKKEVNSAIDTAKRRGDAMTQYYRNQGYGKARKTKGYWSNR